MKKKFFRWALSTFLKLTFVALLFPFAQLHETAQAEVNKPANNEPTAIEPAVNEPPLTEPPVQEPADNERTGYDTKISQDIRGRLNRDLNLYCMDYCSVLNVEANSEESFDSENAQLGFEGASKGGASPTRHFKTSEVKAEILVDTRFGTGNIERLQQLFAKVTARYPQALEIQWSRITFPDNGSAARSESQVRQDFSMQIKNQIERLVSEFCPKECKINTVDANIIRAGMDEVQSGSIYRYLFARDGKGALYIQGITANLTINSEMETARKDRIQSLMREHLSAFGTVNLQTKELPFPKSADEIQRTIDSERNDPYGIERLGRMLKIFREFANTKEIIRERETHSSESKNSEHSKAEFDRSEKNSSLSMAEKERNHESRDSSSSNTLDSQNSFWTNQNIALVGGIGVVLLIVGGLAIRLATAGKQMQKMAAESGHGGNFGSMDRPQSHGTQSEFISPNYSQSQPQTVSNSGIINFSNQGENFRSKMEVQALREELIQTFVTQPKVAREVFGRMLREDGIEYAARNVVIFGEMMVFELLGDADLKQDISTLAEYIHINAPIVELPAQIEMMRCLKLKLTAGKIRMLSGKTMDTFDFLKAKSPRQTYELISDESARSQSMVLTQLPTEKRRAIFELFQGSAKGDLLRELCNTENVTKEYLFNLAEALKRKAISKAGFDGENVQGAEVLLDLLERAQLDDQKLLMEDLDRTNPESSRLIRSRFVSIETLPYLRDGLLLEIFLGLDPNTLTTFLAGTREHIRNLVLRKAPEEMADDWVANLETVRSIDLESLHLAEMQVLSKIRGFALSGSINLLEINSAIYPKVEGGFGYPGDLRTQPTRTFKINNPLVA